MTQARDVIGQFAPVSNSGPELDLTSRPDIEGLRGTLVDFLEGSLPGFNFVVDDIDGPVNTLVAALAAAHLAD